MAESRKNAFAESLALHMNRPSGRSKPGRLQKNARTGAEEPPAEPRPAGHEEPEGSLGDWDHFDPGPEEGAEGEIAAPSSEEPEDSYRPPSRVGRVSIQARLPLHVHRRLDNFLDRAGKMSRQVFLYRIIQAELHRHMPKRARRLRLPVWSGANSQFVQAYIPAETHRRVKVRAAEYGMTIQELLTRLILFRISRGRVPKPIRKPPDPPAPAIAENAA